MSGDILASNPHNRMRALKDRLARYAVTIGGIGVIVAVMLIFVYLFYVVLPLFRPAQVEEGGVLPVSKQPVRLMAVEEQNEVLFLLGADGRARFIHLPEQKRMHEVDLPLSVKLAVESTSSPDWLALADESGQVLLARQRYRQRFDAQGRRSIEPRLEFPFGETPLEAPAAFHGLTRLAFAMNDEAGTLALLDDQRRLHFVQLAISENLMTEELELEQESWPLPGSFDPEMIFDLKLSLDGRWLYVLYREGRIQAWDMADPAAPVLRNNVNLPGQARITAARMLLGGVSLLVGVEAGRIYQLFPVRTQGNQFELELIRDFTGLKSAVVGIYPEQRRKGFVALAEDGTAALYNSTAQRLVRRFDAVAAPIQALTLPPRGDAFYVLDDEGRLHFWQIENEHPEVSWHSLWEKVWYEGYEEPQWVWQSSASSNDFEPKLSLTPLAFGTLKGALYAMIFAVPLAIMGAIFTAHFMAPAMRKSVKPVIEIMEALPTVILGFLAGLWFAPWVERHLTSIFGLLLLLPVGVLLFAWIWRYMPDRWRDRGQAGWQGLVLIPVIVLLVGVAVGLGDEIQQLFFAGDLRRWLSEEVGVSYDQRNALVVGFAMGFAVIPTIFTIAEDAIFSVPKALTSGSLALGASPWQTLMRVVLPTASPGIFSALMIGFGRAVGETMIVLMATGNTPVMDLSPFSGFRTLSANIAVEMPESELFSTHYRVLFLAALVLFLFTFVVNSLAETVRQRLRTKYSSL